jgi:hypothetical protein
MPPSPICSISFVGTNDRATTFADRVIDGGHWVGNAGLKETADVCLGAEKLLGAFA